jgi:hypothetical protein
MALVLSANIIGFDKLFIVRGRSFIYKVYIIKRKGPRIDPWGTPCFTVP